MFRLQYFFDARRVRATADVPPLGLHLAVALPINHIY